MSPSPVIRHPSPAFQRELAVTVSARAVLVDIQAVRSLFGCAAENILHRVDDATREDHIRWVFNLSAGEGHRRELRFWVREIIAPETCAGLTLGAVVDMILGEREQFLRGKLEIEWVCHHQTISALLRTKALNLHGTTIPRHALDNFLRTRWIGSDAGPAIMPGGASVPASRVMACGGTPSAPEKDTVTRQSARNVNGKHASIPARKTFAKHRVEA